ncbi:hypothetical protein FRC10_001225 [Ceratobasidium sp. 414]|nr:hypothetical protein FRC10_001225 [Ceratobasidium sp. 414]
MKLLFYTIASLSLCTLGVLGAATFTNPIKDPNGSDPYMVYSNATTWSNIQITRATTMAGLKTATPKVVWADTTASRCCNICKHAFLELVVRGV